MSPSWRPLASIISWKKPREAVDIINNFRNLEGSPQILLIDQESTESSWSYLQDHLDDVLFHDEPLEQLSAIHTDPRVQIVRSQSNLGFAGAHNQIAQLLASTPFSHLMVFNDDISLHPRVFVELQKTCETHSVSVVGCIVKSHPQGELLFSGATWPGLLWSSGEQTPLENDYVTWHAEASACVYEKSFIQSRIQSCGHFFDPRFFMYCEDSELSVWAQKNGFLVMMASKAEIYHQLSQSLQDSPATKHYYITRNRILLAQLHLPQYTLFQWYYWLSRQLLINSKYRDNREIQEAIRSALRDGFQARFGIWEQHGRAHL